MLELLLMNTALILETNKVCLTNTAITPPLIFWRVKKCLVYPGRRKVLDTSSLMLISVSANTCTVLERRLEISVNWSQYFRMLRVLICNTVHELTHAGWEALRKASKSAKDMFFPAVVLRSCSLGLRVMQSGWFVHPLTSGLKFYRFAQKRIWRIFPYHES